MNLADADAHESSWSYEALRTESDELRTRLNRCRTCLGRFFVDKQPLIDLMFVAAVAQEPLLLVGPPGTAKSELVLKFKDALGVADVDFFEYTLTRATEPGEILGALDRHESRDQDQTSPERGKLTTARVAFLNEVFNANSAVLNHLLTIINEGIVHHDGKSQPVRLRALFGAAEQVPESGEHLGLRDRFVLKAECGPVPDEHFDELIAVGLRSEVDRALMRQPWAEQQSSLTDVLKANRLLTLELAGCDASGEPADRERFFPEPVFRDFQRLIKTLARDDRVHVSDRKRIKMYKLLRVRAWLFSSGVVGYDDLHLLAYLGETLEEIQLLRDKIPLLLGRV